MNSDFEKTVEAFEQAGYEPRSYSGRGMYGRECLGVSCDDALDCIMEVIESFAIFAETTEEISDFVRLLKDARTDSLGLGQIVYWPSIEWETDSE